MIEILSIMPIGFWVVILLLIGGGVFAWRRMWDGTGLPLLAVLGTVAAWYVGDAFYNDYASNHSKKFAPEVLSSAWWQVAWFLAVFLLLTPYLHRRINRAELTRRSGVLQLFKHGMDQPIIQRQLNTLFVGCAVVLALPSIDRLVGAQRPN